MRIGAGVALLATLVAMVAVVVRIQEHGRQPEIYLRATVVGLDGRPIPGAVVALDNLVPNGEGVARQVTMARTATDDGGSFSLSVDASDLRRDRTGGYALRLSMDGLTRSDRLSVDLRAVPAPGGSRWRLELPTVEPAAPRSPESLTKRELNLARVVTNAPTSLVFQVGEGLVADGHATSVPGVRVRTFSGDFVAVSTRTTPTR